MLLKQLYDQDTHTYTYLMADEDTREAVIIDPVLERVDRDLELIRQMKLDLLYTLDTHVHADHVTGSGELRKVTGAISAVGSAAKVPCVDRRLAHGDRLRFGRHEIEARSTPGHTDACTSFVVEADGHTMAFTGDALLIRGCGRTDFQSGDAKQLYRSVREQIFSLPDDTRVYPGHDYRGHSWSTVGEERAHNPRLNDRISETSFTDIMANLDLDPPARIDEALKCNLACGSRPNDAANGASEFKRMSVEQLPSNFEGVVVDVRTFEEFQGPLGHLPQAVFAPLPELRQQASSWPRDVPLLVTCRTGARAVVGCSTLVEMGFTDVTHLEGGMLELRRLETENA